MNIEDILSQEEKNLYEKIMNEVSSDTEFYKFADINEKTASLMRKCAISEKELYIFMKKISTFFHENL